MIVVCCGLSLSIKPQINGKPRQSGDYIDPLAQKKAHRDNIFFCCNFLSFVKAIDLEPELCNVDREIVLSIDKKNPYL